MEKNNINSDNIDVSNIYIKNNNAPPVAFEKKNNINNYKNKNKLFKNYYSKNNFIIQITPFYLDKLKREHYIDIIKFIMENCELYLNDNYNYKNDLFKIKKKKIKNSDNFYYKLSLNKEEKNKIKEIYEKNIIENHEEIKKINLIDKKQLENNIINDSNNDKNIFNEEYFEKDKIFYCKEHNKTFLNQKTYDGHCKSQHRFECLKCGNIFPSIIKVQNHFKDCFQNNNENKMKKEKNEINNKKENEIINNEIKDEDIKVEIDKKINSDENKHDNFSYYECYRDGQKFNDEKSYIKHFEKYHYDDFPFYCEQCNKGFFSSNAIENHIKSKGHIY